MATKTSKRITAVVQYSLYRDIEKWFETREEADKYACNLRSFNDVTCIEVHDVDFIAVKASPVTWRKADAYDLAELGGILND